MRNSLQTLILHESEQTPLPDGWCWRRLEDITITLNPGKLYDESSVLEKGTVPVVNQSAEGFHGYHNDEPGVFAAPEYPVFTFANHTCSMRLMIRPFSCIQNIFSRTGIPNLSDTRFIYYASLKRLSLSGYKGHHPIFRQQWIPVPPIDIQHQIASILSAYDDLIENNRRRMALLEQAARLLYREWFVHLRFPGHEHVVVVDGVPVGWERRTIGDIGEIVTGKTPSKKKESYYGDDVPFIKTPDMHGNVLVVRSDESLSEEGALSQSSKTLPARSILVSCIGSVGVVAMNTKPAQTNQQINAIVPYDDATRYWAYFMALDLKPLLEGMSGGATMANVNKSKFSAIYVIVPSRSLLEQFNEYIASHVDQIEVLSQMNIQLEQARDLLLPRLMNGEIEV